MATSSELLNTSEEADSASSNTHKATTAATVPKLIPKGIPKAVILPGLAGNAELAKSGMQQETAAEGFLKLLGEDEDNLALQKEKDVEQQKAEMTQGEL